MKTIDNPAAQVADLKKKLHDLEHQLKTQQSGSLVNYGTVNIYEK